MSVFTVHSKHFVGYKICGFVKILISPIAGIINFYSHVTSRLFLLLYYYFVLKGNSKIAKFTALEILHCLMLTVHVPLKNVQYYTLHYLFHYR